MQAKSSSNGQLYVWTSATPDDSGFPGPGSAEDIVVIHSTTVGPPAVSAWTPFTPDFECVHVIVQGATGPAINITGTPNDPAGYGYFFVITLGGPRGTATFTWLLNGVTQDTDEPIPSNGIFVLGATGQTANFAAGTYVLNEEYGLALNNAILGNGLLKGHYRKVGTDTEVEILLKRGSSTSFGTGLFKFPLPDGVTFNGDDLLYGEDDDWPYRQIPLIATSKTSSFTLNGFVHPLLVDENDNVYFQHSLTSSLVTGNQVQFRATIPTS